MDASRCARCRVDHSDSSGRHSATGLRPKSRGSIRNSRGTYRGSDTGKSYLKDRGRAKRPKNGPAHREFHQLPTRARIGDDMTKAIRLKMSPADGYDRIQWLDARFNTHTIRANDPETALQVAPGQ